MSKQGVTDSADRLGKRQARVITRLIEGYNQGGLTESEWLELRYIDLRSSSRGHLTDETLQVLRMYTQYKAYRHPHKLLQLMELLEPSFNKLARIYTNKGLLTLDESGEASSVRSSIADPQELETTLADGLKENDTKKNTK